MFGGKRNVRRLTISNANAQVGRGSVGYATKPRVATYLRLSTGPPGRPARKLHAAGIDALLAEARMLGRPFGAGFSL